MSRRAQTLERDWRLLSNSPCLNVDAVVAADDDARELVGELRLAVGLRSAGAELADVDVDVAWEAFAASAGLGTTPSVSTIRRSARRPRRAATVLLVAVLSIVPLSGLALASEPGSPLYGLRRTIERVAMFVAPGSGMELRVAGARLDELLGGLTEGDDALAEEAARALVEARGDASAAGADLEELDRRIRVEVPPALGGVRVTTQEAVRGILGDLLPAPVAVATDGAAVSIPKDDVVMDEGGQAPGTAEPRDPRDPRGGDGAEGGTAPASPGGGTGDDGTTGGGDTGGGSGGGTDPGGTGGTDGSGGGGGGTDDGGTDEEPFDPWVHHEQTAIVVSYDAGTGTLVVERRSGAIQSYRIVGYTEIEWENGDCYGKWKASTDDLVPDAGIVEIDAEAGTIGWMSLVCV